MLKSNLENSLWTEKYRPQNLEDYIGNDDFKKDVKKWVDNNDVSHLLLSGVQGVGKTSAAKLISNSLDADILYINASDESNIDTVRGKIKTFISSVGFARWKIILLDEADGLNALSSQPALRNIMEEYSKTARFILTCNYPEKIIAPIKSRCEVYNLYPPEKKEVAKHISKILKKENIEFNPIDIVKLIEINYPDLRKIISQCQRYSINGKLEVNNPELLSFDYMELILEVLKSKSNPKNKFTQIKQINADNKIKTFDDLYTFLYEKVELYASGNQANIILEIANAARHDINVINKEINAMAMIIEILKIL